MKKVLFMFVGVLIMSAYGCSSDDDCISPQSPDDRFEWCQGPDGRSTGEIVSKTDDAVTIKLLKSSEMLYPHNGVPENKTLLRLTATNFAYELKGKIGDIVSF